MRKTSKKGFTLIEMVLVIAIIVLLASVILVNLTDYIHRCEQTTESVSIHQDAMERAYRSCKTILYSEGMDTSRDSTSETA